MLIIDNIGRFHIAKGSWEPDDLQELTPEQWQAIWKPTDE